MFRSFFSHLMNGTVTIDGRELPGNPVLTKLVMDEIKTLNRLEPLAESSGNMRGHKVMVDAIWQKRSQIEECYGKTESLTDNLGLQKYYAMPPGEEALWLSQRCGSTTKTIKHRNASGQRFKPGPMGNLAENVQTEKVDNLTEYQARNIPADESIVFARGAQMRVKQVRYYENDELQRRSQIPPVEVSDVIVHRPFFLQHLEEQIGVEKFALLTSPAPDPWKEKRDAAKLLKSGVRVFVSESTDAKTAAKSYYLAVWLPGADHPVLASTCASAAERSKQIKACIKFHLGSRPSPKPPKEVQVPHTEGQPGLAVFSIASQSHRDA
jgi:hypothetical protein